MLSKDYKQIIIEVVKADENGTERTLYSVK